MFAVLFFTLPVDNFLKNLSTELFIFVLIDNFFAKQKEVF